MSKHHKNALFLLGIALCAGFLLTVPAVADSGRGLMALESGELFPLSLDDLSAAGNRSEPSGISILSDIGDIASAVKPLPGVGEISDAESTLLSAAPVDVTPEPTDYYGDELDVTPEPTDYYGDELDVTPEPTDYYGDELDIAPEPTDYYGDELDVTPEPTGYDDERLAGLIGTSSVRLMKLSMEHAHALYLQDADGAAAAADDLHALSIRLLGEVQPLQVSPEQQPVKDEFVRSLAAYAAASETLLGRTDPGDDAVPTAFRDLAAASEGLETATRQADEMQPVGARVSTMSAAAAGPAMDAPEVSSGTGPVQVAPPEKVLPLMDRYTYDDPSGENMVSLLAESTRTATAYHEVPANESTPRVEAGEGHTFLLVAVKSTNLGHKGDSDLYTIEAPGRDAFVLECQGTTFTPLEVPPFTSLGESFDRKSLERYESLKGYLYFDVPATLDLSGATLRADLGDAGTAAWDLGKELGEESGDADAV